MTKKVKAKPAKVDFLTKAVELRIQAENYLTSGEILVYENALDAILNDSVPVDRLSVLEMIVRFYNRHYLASEKYWQKEDQKQLREKNAAKGTS